MTKTEFWAPLPPELASCPNPSISGNSPRPRLLQPQVQARPTTRLILHAQIISTTLDSISKNPPSVPLGGAPYQRRQTHHCLLC